MCIECPIGFYGPNCSKPCRNPNYGSGCQRMCRCNETDCNNILGCTVGIDTTVVTEPYELGITFIYCLLLLWIILYILFNFFLIFLNQDKLHLNSFNLMQ